MTANELRIGNLVYFKHCDYDSTIPRKVELVQNPNLLGLEKIAVNRIEFNHVEPIPLTEEWLLKFGFKYRRLGLFEAIKVYDSIGYHIYFSQVHLKEIEYVHQLQNLYFALTGEELTFKP